MATLTSSSVGGGATGGGVETIFNRRIEFHPARKPYSAVSSAGENGFYLETLNPSGAAAQKRPHELAFGAESASGAPGKRVEGAAEFYEHGLDQELGFRITFRRIGAGLANLGNTCFLNSVLQCLTYTEPFAAYLQSGKHKTSCRTAGFCALCALQNHVMNALQSTGKIVSPLHLVRNLRCISRNFRNSRQEDAHEYMVNLLESMHKCCLPSGIPSESPSAYEKSLVHKIFGGRLRSQVKCTQCQFCSNKYDPFLDLSLEIAKAETLRKALLNFTAVEKLDGGEKQYQCQRCKQKVRALKQLTIHKPPHVLTVHLKRFSTYIPGQKIDKKVEFEPFLDLKPFVSDPNEANLKYVLYGVLVHAGWSTHSGHYYCFVRTSTGMWHSLDDNQVRQVSEKTVLSQKAYMLFYVRDRAPVKNSAATTIQKQNPGANNTFGGNASVGTIQKQNPGANNNTFEGKNNKQATTPTMKLNSNSNASTGSQIPVLHVQKPLLDLQSNGNSHPATSKDALVEQPEKKSENIVEIIQKVREKCNASSKAEPVIVASKGDDVTSAKLELLGAASNGTTDTSAKPELKEVTSNVLTEDQNQLKVSTLPKCDPPSDKQATNQEEVNGDDDTNRASHTANITQSINNKILHGKVEEMKSKKLVKHQAKIVVCSARNSLFVHTLRMQKKNKKFQKAKRRRMASIIEGDVIESSDQQVSTSACNNGHGAVVKEEKFHRRKQPKGSKVKDEGDVRGVNVSEANNTVNKENEVTQKCGSYSLLMQGLRETTVPSWDDIESPKVKMRGTEHPKRKSIGYVLDEWDEEYDRGRRKKVKQSQVEFGGPNPFQETAEKKIRKLKTPFVRSGNKPFRN